ncbi:MAG: DegV family EDD domain-containing protein [Anaerolineaceae bacterium]|nr:DegV family EDD domain-containing protein [Anaerolineaceae bacterium]
MSKIAVITDSTAQFPNPSFQGKDLVRIIPLDVEINGSLIKEGAGLKTADLPLSPSDENNTKLLIPSPAEIAEQFIVLLKKFNELLVITNSANLSSFYQNSIEAVKLIQGETTIQVVNSQTIATGLGMIVQAATEVISNGASLTEADRHVRQLIPHVYTLFCTPCLKYLNNINILEYSQAVIGEMLNLHPIFTLEEGYPQAICKVRNFRHAQDYFQEFIEEYDDLIHISLLKGLNTQGIDNRILKLFVQENFPETPFSEHRINPFLGAIFGPKTLGLIIFERPYSLSG